MLFTDTKHNQRGLSKLLIIALLGMIVATVGIVVWSLIIPPTPPPKKATVTIWGVFDDSSDFTKIINDYQALHPYVTVNYVKMRLEEYEDALVKGWATDSGPDIFAIPNSWVTQYSSTYITPAPATTKVAYYTTKKVLFKTETQITYQNEATPSAKFIYDNYVNAAYQDVVLSGAVYALPLGIDTLALYYNRELLSQAHLVQPPTTWGEYATVVSKITRVDEQGSIIRAGGALGTFDNIPRAIDIITLLMLQNGTTMASGKKVTFSQPLASDPTYFPAVRALQFYADFANPDKAAYTWNDKMPNAIDAFAAGQLVFFLGYQYQQDDIRAKSRGIDFAVAGVPQVDPNTEVNYANYWVYTVAKKARNVPVAWNFLKFAADGANVQSYLAATKQASVLRSILSTQLEDPDLGVFARQALTAQTWYRGRAPQAADEYFTAMIKSVTGSKADITTALTVAANQIQAQY
ncbi:MAG: hypothetical protein V1916_01970 [Patescibacteria group bacterium]